MAYLLRICSFVDAEHTVKIGRRTWRWEFHEYLGPTFLDHRGEPLKRQPPEGSPVWPVFNAWLQEYRQKPRAKGCC